MTTLDSTALWSATALAFDERKIGTAGLSVRQRKLLALLAQPASVQQLAQTIALPIEEVHTVLERFAKLGLAQSNVEEPVSPMQARVTAHAAASDSPSRTPMYIGIALAALAVVAAAAWFLRSGTSSSAAPQTAAVTAPKTAAPTATGPADSADTVSPRNSAAPGASAAPVATAAAPAANTKAAAPVTAAPAPASAPPAATKAAATPPAQTPPVAAAKSAVAPQPATTATPATATAPASAAPATTAAAAPVTTASPPPAAAPATAAPATTAAAAPATAAPAPAPAAARPAPREIKLVNRVEPGFPRGVDAEKGSVKARLQVDARGAVTGIDIIESSPPRVFDRAVRNALTQWRYEPTGEAFTVQAEINFSR